MKKYISFLYALLSVFLLFSCSYQPPYSPPETQFLSGEQTQQNIPQVNEEGFFNYREIPEFDGSSPYVIINSNNPFFDDELLIKQTFESYGELDRLGRCTVVFANVCQELMPTEERGSIGSVKPSGWQTVKYDCVDGNYLYNRCHLIGYQLTGENANTRNLITGTRYMNVQGMLPFEDMVADYVKETNNHVLYRVTPIFLDNELLARGVLMEAYSLEDDGEGICFNVFCYNSQPEIRIDYATGESKYVGKDEPSDNIDADYVLNKNSKKFHLPDCSSVGSIKEQNRSDYKGSRDDLIKQGYAPCGSCKP